MRIALSGAIAAATAFFPAAADQTPWLNVQASPARVEVEPGPAGLRHIELPDLVFSLSIRPDCAGGEPESISISVADTSETLRAEDLAASSIIEAKLSLPAQQTAPLSVDRFCAASESAQTPPPAVRTVRDVFTAHLSLRCARDGIPSIVYLTVPLSLELACKIPESQPGLSGQDVSDPAADWSPRY